MLSAYMILMATRLQEITKVAWVARASVPTLYFRDPPPHTHTLWYAFLKVFKILLCWLRLARAGSVCRAKCQRPDGDQCRSGTLHVGSITQGAPEFRLLSTGLSQGPINWPPGSRRAFWLADSHTGWHISFLKSSQMVLSQRCSCV